MCNAAHDSVDRVCRWERITDIAAFVLQAPGEIHEAQLRRARKALSDLFVLLVDDTAAPVRTMCGSRTGGWSLPCVMSD
jgi:hypothetical protein